MKIGNKITNKPFHKMSVKEIDEYLNNYTPRADEGNISEDAIDWGVDMSTFGEVIYEISRKEHKKKAKKKENKMTKPNKKEMKHYYQVEKAKIGDKVYIIIFDDDEITECIYLCDLRELSIKTDYPHVVRAAEYGIWDVSEIYKLTERK